MDLFNLGLLILFMTHSDIQSCAVVRLIFLAFLQLLSLSV